MVFFGLYSHFAVKIGRKDSGGIRGKPLFSKDLAKQSTRARIKRFVGQ